jgi:hypothetical protein
MFIYKEKTNNPNQVTRKIIKIKNSQIWKENKFMIQMYKADNYQGKRLSLKKRRKIDKGVYLLDKNKILKKEIVCNNNKICK